MAKVKKKSLILENKIFRQWTALGLFLERFLSQRTGDYCQRLKYLVTEKISADCNSDVNLSAYDVDIFHVYGNIMQAYKKVLAHSVAGEGVLKNAPVREIWEGICALIVSRLITDDEMHHDINPVLAEKQSILAQEIAAGSGKIDEIFVEFKLSKKWDNMRQSAKLTLLNPEFSSFNELINGLAKGVLKSCENELYEVYVKTAKNIVAGLNNLEARSQAAGYNNLLKEEIEILRQIIVVQAVAIEKAIWKKEIEPAENDFLSEALNLLRETYQQEGHACGAINKAFLEAAAQHKKNMGKVLVQVMTQEEFKEALTELVPCRDMPLVFETLKSNVQGKVVPLKKALNEFMFTHIESFDTNLASKKAYFCKKATWQAGQMSIEASLAFADCVNHFEKKRDELMKLEESDIIKGVSETIIIKIDTLRESAQEFFAQTDALVEKFGEEARSRQGRDELYLASESFVIDKLLQLDLTQKHDAQAVADAFDELLKADFFAEHKAGIERAWAKREEALNKKILNFKRDGLFFELSTFEEIMFYSITRLRESENAHIAEFVEEVDKVQKKIEAILARFDIQKIVPLPHTPFNAKEHEVLMAEINEGFKKGEIIKTMNSGYRQGEQVIVRANVIAAR